MAGIFLSFFFWILKPLSVTALDPHQTITEYTLTIWNAENGLPQNSDYTIGQSSEDFLWMGTQEGIGA